VNARYVLVELARLFKRHNLEAVMLGNAGAALHGAPVTTMDVDFVFRPTPVNVRKLKSVAKDLGAVIFRPFYPVSGMYRLSRDADQVQVDFMDSAKGLRSFEGIRARAERVDFDGCPLFIASLADIIKSKTAAGRPKDMAVLDVLKETAERKQGKSEEAG
jgi:predicted nucleotidyltransferase